MKGKMRYKSKQRKSIVPIFLATVASLIIVHIIVLVLLGFKFFDTKQFNTLNQVHYFNALDS
jgi:hypothetical protein